jgi:hypothetical protein
MSCLPVFVALVFLGPADETFFRSKVVPILQQKCLHCHNPTNVKGNVDLSQRRLVVEGDEALAVPNKPDDSRLLEVISGDKPKMPSKEPPLTKAEQAILREWIERGAVWPEGVTLKSTKEAWWSLRPLQRPAVPKVNDTGWGRTPIDAFIWQQLQTKELKPQLEADRRTLLRRLSFDLIGLPPTPEEMEDFLKDTSPNAYEKQIDRLLASPHYGERWGRHWLDVVHYADTHGYDKDKRRDHAWPYRDYVIRSLNADKPYGRFVQEQLAGDVLFPKDPDGIVATGFLAAGPWDFVGHVELREGSMEKLKTRSLDRDDYVATTASTYLSLTVHCARCHDHKFDPISAREYYQLQAVFAGIERGDRASNVLVLPGGKSPPRRLKVYAVQPTKPRPIHLLHRGEVAQAKDVVNPQPLRCVQGVKPFSLPADSAEGERRAALARWITDQDNGLAWRSIANRVWHHHFGRGLVDTPNDFGRNGSLPTHPELLDWLAVELRDNGQSLKKLHKLIVMSSVYRQTSKETPEGRKLDADNRLLWRMHRHRLDVEALRDSVLAVSGKLNRTLGGPAFQPFRFKDDHSPVYDHSDALAGRHPSTFRRSVYRFVVRSVPHPYFDCLDCADPNVSTPARNVTITPLQALSLLNDPFMLQQAEFFAERLKQERQDVAGQIERAYQLVLGRSPTTQERQLLVDYAKKHGLENACRVLWNLNEFLFID